jgi:hypothetical protein
MSFKKLQLQVGSINALVTQLRVIKSLGFDRYL